MNNSTNVSLLEKFYEHVDEDDWLDGVDIYQSGRIHGLTSFHSLISAKVPALRGESAEVRIKLHPEGHSIQWIECTCRRNRTYGEYCEHIVALMVHIDRELPKVFSKLNNATPLRAPAKTRKRRKDPTEPKPTKTTSADSQDKKSLIEQFAGNIHSVTLIARGPALRVRLELKPGKLTHYDLNTDAAAKFLKSHYNLPSIATDLKSLRVFDQYAEFATKISEVNEEQILAERVVVFPKSDIDSIKQAQDPRHNFTVEKLFSNSNNNEEAQENEYLVLPIKSAMKFLDQEYIFLPDIGYWPIDRKQIKAAWHDLPFTKTYKEDEAAKFIESQFGEFSATGPILCTKDLAGVQVSNSPKLLEIKLLQGNDGWFELDPRYGEGSVAVSMSDLLKHFKNKKRKFVKSGKNWLAIPDLVTQFDWQLSEDESSIVVDNLGLLRLKAALGEFDDFVGSKKALSAMRESLEFKEATSKLPTYSSSISLRGYQQDGLRWLWWLYQNQLHGLLADEMGLGKTHQAMALMSAITSEVKDPKFLVICPTTVLDHWLDKVEQYAPELKPMKFHGQKRATQLSYFEKNCHLLITSYGIILRDIKNLSKIPWAAVILDEAHFVKNNDTATYQAVCKLQSKIRICLSGTPMENHLGELKNIFDFLLPGYLGSDDYFKKNYIQPVQNQESVEAELNLQKLLYPFKLRRTKQLVLTDLPDKVEDVRHCGLSNLQVRLYREVLEMKAKPLIEQLMQEEKPMPYLHVFAVISLLKQICDHPALVEPHTNYRNLESGKFELLKELLTEAVASGHKIVIFSQYLKMLDIIMEHLKDQGIPAVSLTGATRDRGRVIKQFQTNDHIKVFCGSLLAGGIGIDLTAANVVIHYDRWWNASKENQATDRVHRIGQNKNVQVLKLITRGTLEEKIDKLIQRKQELFEKFLDKDEEVFKTLSRQEIIELLQ